MTERSRALREGVAAALGAYAFWGMVPLFFKQLAHVPAPEIIVHRILWSLLLMGAILAWRQALGAVWRQARQPRTLAHAALAAGLVVTNWLVYVWAVNAGRILDASLGYFVNPLISIMLGVLVLRERLRPRQWVAIALAGIGVAIEGWRIGGLPWVSLTLAVSFGLYGLLRKKLPLDAAGGLFLETVCVAPIALIYLLWLGQDGQFGVDPATSGLLAATGPVTALPLLLFAIGARRLPLVTLGFLQYLSPTLAFLVALWVYGEPLSAMRLLAFAAIWVGLALYTADMVLNRRL